MASYPELCVIGSPNIHGLKLLRDKMIGTPTVRPMFHQSADDMGAKCIRFLDQVKKHPSKASQTYYYKYFSQYFQSIRKSLCELDRVCKYGAKIGIVVQDSYYKEIRADLAAIFDEMGTSLGWRLSERFDFPVRRNMSRVHVGSRKYRTTSDLIESFIVFQKGISGQE